MTERRWRKSTRTDAGGSGNCVEVAFDKENVYIRDSKDPDGGELAISPGSWMAFLESITKPQY